MMIVEKSMNPTFLSNSYLVGDAPGGRAAIVDTGGPMEPILAAVERHRLHVTHVLCTHHHVDHIQHNADYKQRFGCAIAGHPAERGGFGGLDLELSGGEELSVGDLGVRVLHVPGHTKGQLTFVVDGQRAFTGDTLFRRAVGGTRAPGHATFEELRRSIMDVLMRLPHETIVHPGHTDDTTIGEEWEHNPFIRVWRGIDEPDRRRCTAFGRPATLLVRARDYDGGFKCWVRFDEGGVLDVVPGSQVRVEGD